MERKGTKIIILLAFCCILLVLPVIAAENGKIVFVSNRNGVDEIFVMNSDGSGQTGIHYPADISVFGTDPDWSKDGTKIAYVSNGNIFVMNPDGSDQTDTGIDGNYPRWSPDGKKIAYAADNYLYVMDADGSNAKTISESYYWGARSSSWSPDGTKIAFMAAKYYPNYNLIVMDADGNNAITITPGALNYPAWSPDGTKIIFSYDSEGVRFIYTINPDGTGKSDSVATGTNPDWSPDGTKIIYNSGGQIYVMNKDGSGQTQMTSIGNNIDPSWSTFPNDPPISAPEFPSTFLPVSMIIGFLGAVLFIQRTREH
jgi:Tol biopolymer transport system component